MTPVDTCGGDHDQRRNHVSSFNVLVLGIDTSLNVSQTTDSDVVLQVSKFQVEIDLESENRAELARMEREAADPAHRTKIRQKIAKSDERIQSLAILMLHYCAGLQNCMDTQEQTRQEQEQEEEQEKVGHAVNGAYEDTVQEGIPRIVTEEPSTHDDDSDDTDSDDSPPIYMKTTEESTERAMQGETTSFSS